MRRTPRIIIPSTGNVQCVENMYMTSHRVHRIAPALVFPLGNRYKIRLKYRCQTCIVTRELRLPDRSHHHHHHHHSLYSGDERLLDRSRVSKRFFKLNELLQAPCKLKFQPTTFHHRPRKKSKKTKNAKTEKYDISRSSIAWQQKKCQNANVYVW